MKDVLKIANKKLKSRLIVGTGKYKSLKKQHLQSKSQAQTW